MAFRSRRGPPSTVVLVVGVCVACYAAPYAWFDAVAYLRGEPFYRGRPASYWRHEIERYQRAVCHGGSECYRKHDAPFPAFLVALGDRTGVNLRVNTLVPPDGWRFEGAAGAAVLAALRDDPSPDVRRAARLLLARPGRDESEPTCAGS